MSKNGFTGTVFGIAVLPATVRELVEAIYNQKDLKQDEALQMADYLDDKYNISPYVPATPVNKE